MGLIFKTRRYFSSRRGKKLYMLSVWRDGLYAGTLGNFRTLAEANRRKKEFKKRFER